MLLFCCTGSKSWVVGPPTQRPGRSLSQLPCRPDPLSAWCCWSPLPDREAKLSVLCWDTELSELAPTGLHYFEGDPALKAGRTLFPTPPIAVADPQVWHVLQGPCLALLHPYMPASAARHFFFTDYGWLSAAS